MIGCNGRFEKVLFETFLDAARGCAAIRCLCENDFKFQKRMEGLYRKIRLPMRATDSSSGYDFFAPFDFVLNPGEDILVTTGIRVVMPENAALICVPRSGSGFRYGLKLSNTVGVVDLDFYNSETESEGHIMMKLMNHDSDKKIVFHAGDEFVQGIVVPYATFPQYDAEQWEKYGVQTRSGGFGSTKA